MNNTTIINNSVYEFDISLINTRKGSEVKLPLPKGAVEYLEIDNNLAEFGLSGKCRISNFYGILEQLNVLDVKSINCMYISIRNTDFTKANVTNNVDTSISFLAILTKCADTSTNIIDKSVSFTFEEYYVARTRMESIDDTFKPTQDTPGNIIRSLFTYSNEQSTLESVLAQHFKGIDRPLFDISSEVPYKVKLTDFYDGDKVRSIFDLIQECYKYLSFSSGPGIISMDNVEEDGLIQRKVTLQPLANYIVGFYEKYRNGEVDLSDFVTDEFIIGDASSSNSLNTNFIDCFNFLRVDQSDLLTNKWIDYNITDTLRNDLTNTLSNIIYYTDVKYEFATQLLNNYNANLPDRDSLKGQRNEKVNIKVIHKKLSDGDSILTRIYVENALKKSFIYDNTAITFTVAGNTYRKAGKFIRVRAKDFNKLINNRQDPTQPSNIDGYWFIIGIKHIFKGDFYTNEYTCVKLHSEGNAIQPKSNDNPLINILNPQGNVGQSNDAVDPILYDSEFTLPPFSSGGTSNTGAGGAPGVLPNRTTPFIDAYNDKIDPITNPFTTSKTSNPITIINSEGINTVIGGSNAVIGNSAEQEAVWDKIQKSRK